MDSYEISVVENIERVRIKINRIVDASNYIDPLGYKKHSSLVDLVNHQKNLIDELQHYQEKPE